MDAVIAILDDLPPISLGHVHDIPPINPVDEFMDAFMNLPSIPLLRQPHLILPVNDEEVDEIEVDVVDPAHLPAYGPSEVFQADLISTRLPNHWSEYSEMNYFGLEEEYQDEDQNREEEDLEDYIQGPIKRPTSTNHEAKQGPIKRLISSDQYLEDMIKSSGGEPSIATIGLQDRNTTGPAFGPTLERPFSCQ